jgi:hypothetical protein
VVTAVNTAVTVVDTVKQLADSSSQATKPVASQSSSGSVNPPQSPKNDPKDKDKPKPGPCESEGKGFSGHRGYEMKNSEFQKHQNKPETIDGHQYSGHALDQMRNRGIPISVVKRSDRDLPWQRRNAVDTVDFDELAVPAKN